MNNKTLSIVSYITLIGWLIAYFSGKENADSLLKYHLKQSLGLLIVIIFFNIALGILISIVPALSLLSLIGFVFIALLIIGIINAANEVKKPLPLIGKMFEDKFSFIN
ncbi:DUF4870 domain-containing protein [Chryseobacterium oranimense]|uniref:DUF4870 domain-containing protein n=1 Tax=Chryseobacterium oranimense TaxID=421058 RepID=UPI0021B00053|nr:DUF4870 domain-containing protein [Chryseobacterium oranimense]UWX61781.1 DUF4870 domain-containing protein [Chryseobacterium oranimense]